MGISIGNVLRNGTARLKGSYFQMLADTAKLHFEKTMRVYNPTNREN